MFEQNCFLQFNPVPLTHRQGFIQDSGIHSAYAISTNQLNHPVPPIGPITAQYLIAIKLANHIPYLQTSPPIRADPGRPK